MNFNGNMSFYSQVMRSHEKMAKKTWWKSRGIRTEVSKSPQLYYSLLLFYLAIHPSLDTPQKKNQKTHLGDPKIYQVEGMDIPKQEVAKFS